MARSKRPKLVDEKKIARREKPTFGWREEVREGVLRGKEKRKMSRQVDKKATKQVRIDSGLHKLVKVKAAELGETIRNLVEAALVEYLGSVKRDG